MSDWRAWTPATKLRRFVLWVLMSNPITGFPAALLCLYFGGPQDEGYLKRVGWVRSFRARRPIDRSGEPIPYYTYPCIEYLKAQDFSKKSVLEFGSGNSSYWWRDRAQSVLSLENDEEWAQWVSGVRFVKGYIQFGEEHTKKYDIIVVDAEPRADIIKRCLHLLNAGGMIIVDNADRPDLASGITFLKDHGFTEIPFCGFGPALWYQWTTSVFVNHSGSQDA